MGVDIGGIVGRAVDVVQSVLNKERNEPRYDSVVDKLVSPNATQEQRDRAYDLVAQIEEQDKVCYTDEALTERSALALAEDRTIPLNVAEVAPLVPAGTALGPFASADEAATAMMAYSNPLSIAANLENGGLILQDGDGNFYATTPLPGSLSGFDLGTVPIPDGMTSAGFYHGHADYSKTDGTRTDQAGDEFNSDHFSDTDKTIAENGTFGPLAYVSTPSGDFRRYDSATDQDTVIN